ncbi:hypothetical protein C8R47DRAFT_1084534 [Mycena vitilis]|nr:hypothetical protein C8R47DRAFT_1084534 [Mycena vitilis]
MKSDHAGSSYSGLGAGVGGVGRQKRTVRGVAGHVGASSSSESEPESASGWHVTLRGGEGRQWGRHLGGREGGTPGGTFFGGRHSHSWGAALYPWFVTDRDKGRHWAALGASTFLQFTVQLGSISANSANNSFKTGMNPGVAPVTRDWPFFNQLNLKGETGHSLLWLCCREHGAGSWNVLAGGSYSGGRQRDNECRPLFKLHPEQLPAIMFSVIGSAQKLSEVKFNLAVAFMGQTLFSSRIWEPIHGGHLKYVPECLLPEVLDCLMSEFGSVLKRFAYLVKEAVPL